MTFPTSNFTFIHAHFTRDKIPEGTDLLTLEIYAQLMDFYTTELELFYDIEKASNYIKSVPIAPRWEHKDLTMSHGHGNRG